MAQHQPGHDGDDFDALDFSYSGGSAADAVDASDADPLDFAGGDHAGDAAATFDEVPDYAPEQVDVHATSLDAVDAAVDAGDEADDEDALPLFTVTNPPGTVSVSANISGMIQQVELSAKVNTMSEAELADEILVLAGLARQKGLAGQHAFVVEQAGQNEEMRELGADDTEGLSNFLAMPTGLNLPTPQQATAAEAEVFATRYPVAE